MDRLVRIIRSFQTSGAVIPLYFLTPTSDEEMEIFKKKEQ